MSPKLPRLQITHKARIPPTVLRRLPKHMRHQRISDLDEITLDNRGSVLVLEPPEAADVLSGRRALKDPSMAGRYVVILWLAAPTKRRLEPALLTHPLVAGVIESSTGPDAISTMVKSAFALVERAGEHEAAKMLEQLLDIGRSLASEKDLDKLLGQILTHACNLTGADGAAIYTMDRDRRLKLHFWQMTSTNATSAAQRTIVGDYGIAGYVARSGKIINIADAYRIPKNAPYRFNPAFDSSLGYRTRSLLTLPLTNKTGEVDGVLQLFNRKAKSRIRLKSPKDFEQKVLPFNDQSRAVAQALAGQAGVALENSMLYADIEQLFEGFIKASVRAIEARDPSTAGHSFRVAEYTQNLATAVDRSDRQPLRRLTFSSEQMRELRYAALLHDFGKVGVREQILVKAKKLYAYELEIIRQRFQNTRTLIKMKAYRDLLTLGEERLSDPRLLAQRRRDIEQSLDAECARLNRFLTLVQYANEPTVAKTDVTPELADVAAYRYLDEDGRERPLIYDFELNALTLAKGSLGPEERLQIESHVTHTFAFLSLIPWTKTLANLPDIAYAHHEKLDGSGYPRGLRSDQIPVQSKIMTIADIYDALTAGDRPYKHGLPSDQALDILHAEVKSGKIDNELYRVFVESQAYRLK